MKLHKIREELRTKTIYDLPLRVTFYARVSTEKDEQLNSLNNQVIYYKNYIQQNKNWTYVPGYIDEGLSGITTTKRENFNQMVDDAAADMFDLVITREITRFARNTLDSIKYTRQLLTDNVGVLFENDNICTFDDDSELRLTIMSGIAQDEVRKLSKRVKAGHQQAIKNGVVLGNSRIFGYKKKDGKLIIDPDEAPMVKELFELYATDRYTMSALEKLFWDKGYRNRNGNKIAHSTMSGVIANPKYKGYYVGNKVKVVDMFTKEQYFLPPEEWVMFKDESGDIVPAIVDEELWERANAVLSRRSKDVKNRQNKCNHPNLLTKKMYCPCCNAYYYRRDSKDKLGNSNSKWVCSGKINNGADSCPSFAIYEEEIKPILYDVFKETSHIAEDLIEYYIELYKTLEEDKEIAKQIDSIKSRLDLEEKKKRKLLEYNVNGDISDKEFLQMNAESKELIEELQAELLGLYEKQNNKETLNEHIKTIRKVLRDAERDIANGIITPQFANKYIDRIIVIPDGDTLRLEIKIFTGEVCERYLQNLKSRSGHISKKMIQAYENSMK